MSDFNEFGHRVKPRISISAYFSKLLGRRTTEDGREIVSSVPMAPPIGYNKQPTMIEHIRNMVRSEHLRRAAEEAGVETFEESDDFDVEDDPFPRGAYEFDESELEPGQEPATTSAVASPPAAPEQALEAAETPQAASPAAVPAAAPKPPASPAKRD